MVTLQDIRNHREQILEIATRHGASRLRLFGSIVRGQTKPTSDVDLLVHMDEDRSLLDRVALVRDLEGLLTNPVDVVNDRALHPLIRDEVLAEAIDL